MKTLMRLIRDESGQGLVEYVLIIALIAVVCIVILRNLGQTTSSKLDEVETGISNG